MNVYAITIVMSLHRQWPEEVVLENDDDDTAGAEMHNRSTKRNYALVRTNSAAEE
jgi:protein associated with RNAse G/E